MKVVHKGFVIVATPLLFQLVIITAFASVLILTDSEYKVAWQWREISVAGSRLMLENFRIGEIIATAWAEKNPAIAMGLGQQLNQVDALTVTLEKALNDKAVQDVIDRDSVVQQRKITADLRQMVALADEPLNAETIRNLLATKKALALDLGTTFTELHKLLQKTESTILRSQARLELLADLEIRLVFGSLLLTILVGAFIALYYRRHFLKPIRCMLENIDLMAQNRELHPPLTGNDEIASFDRAFHKMQQQLALVSEREKALFDNSSDVICVLSDEQRFVRVNDCSSLMWEYAPAQLENEDLSIIAKEGNLQKLRDALRSSRAEENSVSVEVDLERSDGKTVSTLWSVIWSKSQTSWYCAVHDVSERKRIEKLKERFLGLIVRDCQTPFNRINELYGNLESEQYGHIPEEAKAKCRMTMTTLSRLISLVNKLTASDQILDTDRTASKTNVVVQAVLEAAKQDVNGLSLQHNVSVHIDCQTGLRFNVDKESMIRVIVNLLSNAIKFSPENAVVTVGACQREDLVHIFVRDTGRGIPQDSLGKLFQPFTQVSAADGKRGQGTGLGLAAVKRTIEEHGGSVKVESELLKGTTFFITIPQASDHQSIIDQSSSSSNDADHAQDLFLSDPDRQSGKPARAPAADTIALKGKALVLTGVPTILGLAYITLLLSLVLNANHDLSKEINERKLSSVAKRLTFSFYDIALRIKLADDLRTSSAAIKKALDALPSRIKQFNRVARSNPGAQELAPGILKSVAEKQLLLNSAVESTLTDTALVEGRIAALADISWSAANSVRQSMQSLLSACESREHVIPEKLKANRSFQLQLLLLALAGNLALSSWLAIYFGNSLSKRLAILADNSRRFAIGENLNQPLSGGDEIAQLDFNFHQMAKTLEIARERESAFLNNSRSLICSLNENLKFTACNTTLTPMFGLNPRALENVSISSILTQADRAQFETALQSAKERLQPTQIETHTDSLDRRPLYLSWSLAWSNREPGFFCIAHDVTAQKELQRLRREFIAVVSHDLRSPLTTVLSMTSLLSYGVFGTLPLRAMPVLDSISSESERVLKLVNDLLDIEKLDAGQMQLLYEPVELKHLLGDVADEFQSVVLECQTNATFLVSADEDRLKLCFSDLLCASQSAIPQSVLVRISADSGLSRVEIICSKVSCHESAQLLVERCNSRDGFSHAESMESGATSRSGTLLNIALTQRVLEAHDGLLSADLTGEMLVIVVCLPSGSDTMKL